MTVSERDLGAGPYAIGFIGGSTKSAVGYAHFASCRIDNLWQVKAGCFSPHRGENEETADVYGVPRDRLYRTWQEMLQAEKGRLDAILVVTPTPTHFEIVRACLEAGYAVICEKALATTLAEAEDIQRACRQADGFLAVTYNYSGYPAVRELACKIENGELGKLLHFHAEMPQEGFIRVDAQGNKPVPQEWRLVDGQIPTIYLDLAVHLHQLVHYLTRKSPVGVFARHESFGWFPSVIDNVAALAEYSDGMKGQYWFSKSALGHRNGLRMRIYGSEAAAEWFQANPEEVIVSYRNGRREILDRGSPVSIADQQRYSRFKSGHPAGFVEAFANLYRDIAGCVEQHRSTGRWESHEVFGVELALEGLAMMEAMVKSAKTGTWQPVPTRTESA